MQVIKNLLLYFKDNWLALLALLISIISLLITLIKNIKDRRYAKDKELLEQLKQPLELAYRSLVIEGNNIDSLTNDRLCWNTSARHIIRYWDLKKSLKTKLYKTICEEQEEHWRSEIYKLLDTIPNSNFYMNPDSMNEEGIDPKAAADVHAFSDWKKGKADPIDTVSFEEIVCEYDLFSLRHRHFREYIEKVFPESAEKIKKKSS